MNWDLEAERELWADICRRDFWWFFREAWGIDHNPKARSFTPRIHKPICEWLDRKGKEWLASRRNKRPVSKYLALLVPREFWKTTLTGAFLAWLHVQDPDLSAYIGSESLTQAEMWFLPIFETLRGSNVYARFPWLYGNWEAKDRRYSKFEVITAARRDTSIKEPSFGTWGVATGLTGCHPDILDLDDPISYDRLERDSSWLDTVNAHVDTLLPVLKADGLMIWPGTRYGDGDHFGEGFRKLGVKSVDGMPFPDHSTDCIRPNGKFEVYFLQGREMDRTPVFPEQWPEWRLLESEVSSSLRHAAQIMNDPSSSAYNPLTMLQVNQCWVPKETVPFAALKYTIHCDTAFWYQERQARGDESVITVWGHLPGTGDVYFIEGHGSRIWRSEEFSEKLVQIVQRLRAKRWRIAMITDEREMFGKSGAWETLLRNAFHNVNLAMPTFVQLQRGGTQKIKRITNAAGYWVDGHVKLIEGTPGVDDLIKQMTTIGSSSHDDWADAAADVFHKDVYVPMRRIGRPSEVSESPSYPGDEWLKTGNITGRELIKLYDKQNIQFEQTPFEAID